MNAAPLTRRWQEAAGDPARMAEALIDEINGPATGLVTRDFLGAELAEVRSELRQEMGRQRHDFSQETGQLRQAMAELRQEMAGLRADMAGLRQEMAEPESRLTWRIVTLLGAQIALVGILVTIPFQVLR